MPTTKLLKPRNQITEYQQPNYWKLATNYERHRHVQNYYCDARATLMLSYNVQTFGDDV